MKDQVNYVEAFEELQRIVKEIEQGLISVDELSEKVRKAVQLIRICKSRLTETEADVHLILNELDASTKENKG